MNSTEAEKNKSGWDAACLASDGQQDREGTEFLLLSPDPFEVLLFRF